MTLALAAAIGVLVGWFGNPLWFRIADRIWVWRMRRRNRRSPAPPSTLASVAATYKQMYAPNMAETLAARPVMRFSEMRKFHVVGAIDGGHAVTYPNAAAEVEAAIAEEHERLSRDSLAAGEVVGLADWIPKSTPDEAA